MNSTVKYDIKNIISALHRRDDFSLVEKLAKIVEKNIEDIETLTSERNELKQKLNAFEKYDFEKMKRNIHQNENDISSLNQKIKQWRM